jgi:hypothetical protein
LFILLFLLVGAQSNEISPFRPCLQPAPEQIGRLWRGRSINAVSVKGRQREGPAASSTRRGCARMGVNRTHGSDLKATAHLLQPSTSEPSSPGTAAWPLGRRRTAGRSRAGCGIYQFSGYRVDGSGRLPGLQVLRALSFATTGFGQKTNLQESRAELPLYAEAVVDPRQANGRI